MRLVNENQETLEDILQVEFWDLMDGRPHEIQWEI